MGELKKYQRRENNENQSEEIQGVPDACKKAMERAMPEDE
jgi:hypothetical protein